MRRGSWVRAVLFLADTHQPAAPAAMSTMITNTVEVQYNQAGPTGCPHAAEGFPPCRARARTPALRLTSGAAFPDRIAVIAAPAQRTREPNAPTTTAVNNSVSVVLRLPGRAGEGDMTRLPGGGYIMHAGAGVEQLQLAIGDQVADDEGTLPHSPKPFSALKIGQLVAFGHRQPEDLGGARGLG